MIEASLLHISLVEYDPQWLEVDLNLNFLNSLTFQQGTHLIVLPEMFATGFCMEPEKFAKQSAQKIETWMHDFSFRHNTAICGSIAIEDDGNFFNRFYCYDKGELIVTYDKRHLFSYSGEDKVYKAGNEKVVFEYLGWKICPEICYDLRFPVWFRNTENYDILLNVANWPESRIEIWNTLLKARAIENMCYTVACNRIGKDGNNLDYNGHSQVQFPSLEMQDFTTDGVIKNFILDKNKLVNYRLKFPFLEDQDPFKIE